MAKGHFQQAQDLSDVPLDKVPINALRAEFVATRALALAVAGDTTNARLALDMKEGGFLDAQIEGLKALTSFIIELRDGNVQERDVDGLLSTLDRLGHFDGLVFTYRAVPDLLVLAWAKPRWRTLIESITSAADDSNMLAQLGLHHKGSLDENPSSLTPRETEVLAFVVQGLRNREIASRLYISEVTVKTHLRHVYEKLGVRSRTEAVLVATGRLDG